MPQAERTRLESLYKTALEERSWERSCEERKRRKVTKTDQKGETGSLWGQQSVALGLANSAPGKRYTPKNRESGDDKEDGYLYRERFPFPPITLKQTPALREREGNMKVLATKDFLQGDRITPVGGQLFIINKDHLFGYSRLEYRIIKDMGQEVMVISIYKTARENVGMGHLLRASQIQSEVNAMEQIHDNGVRIIATRSIGTGDEIVIAEALGHAEQDDPSSVRHELDRASQTDISQYMVQDSVDPRKVQDHIMKSNKSAGDETRKRKESKGKRKLDKHSEERPPKIKEGSRKTSTCPPDETDPEIQNPGRGRDQAGPPGTKAGIDRANTLSDFGTARTRLVRRWTQDEYKNDYAGLADEGGDFPNPLRTLYLDRSDPRPWVSGEVILSIGTLIGHHAKKYLNNNFWAVRDHWVTLGIGGTLSRTNLEKAFRRFQIKATRAHPDGTIPSHMDLMDIIALPIKTANHWILGILDFRDKDKSVQFRLVHSMQTLPQAEQPLEWDRDHLAKRLIDSFLQPSDVLKTKDLRGKALENWKVNGHVMEESPQQNNYNDCGVFLCGALACAAYGVQMKHNPVRAGRIADEYRMRIGHDLEKKEIKFTLTALPKEGVRVVQPGRGRGHDIADNGKAQKKKGSKRNRIQVRAELDPDPQDQAQTGVALKRPNKSPIRTANGKEMIIVQLKPPWPMALGSLIAQEDSGDIVFQWYTTLSSKELAANSDTKYDDPLKAYIPCWTCQGSVYSGNNPRQDHHVPYTSRHTNMELHHTQILIRAFKLLPTGHIPIPILKQCEAHERIYWPGRHERERVRNLIDARRGGAKVCSSLGAPHKGIHGQDPSVLPGTRNSINNEKKEVVRSTMERADSHSKRLNGFKTCRQVSEPIRKYLHTTRSLYTNAIHVDEPDEWYSTDVEDAALKATNGSTTQSIK